MNYWAESDPLFEDGHYVEEWELQRFQQFSPAVQSFAREQAALGNKVRSIAFPTMFLSAEPTCGPLGLPEGLCFFTSPFATPASACWTGTKRESFAVPPPVSVSTHARVRLTRHRSRRPPAAAELKRWAANV